MSNRSDGGSRGQLPPAAGLSTHAKIDVCRGLFAILVVAAHALDIAWTVHPEARWLYPSWLRDALQHVVAAGIHWVMGFFVISGYCIQLSVSKSTRDGWFPVGRYFRARFSRIIPLYYPALLFAVVVEVLIAPARPFYWYHGVDLPGLIAQLFIVQNLADTFGSFAPSWSITNEIVYYVLFGLLVAMGARLGARATVVGLVLCVVLAMTAQLHYFRIVRATFLVRLGQLFGLGMIWFLGALVAENAEAFRRSRAWRLASGFWPLALAAGMALWYRQLLHIQFVCLVVGAAFALMLIHFLSTEPANPRDRAGGPTHRLVEMLGLSSYPMYLFHGPLVMLIGSSVLRWRWTDDWRITWIVLFAAGVTSGLALGQLAEKPIMRWRNRWLGRATPAPRSPIGGAVPIGMMGVQQ